MPTPTQPLAIENEFEMAFQQGLVGIVQGTPLATIPDDHRAAAIFSLRDRAFEIEIFERMVLGSHGQAFVGDHQAWSLRNGPAQQDPFVLEPEIVMQPSGVVLLQDEARTSVLLDQRSRLAGATEISPPAIGLQFVGSSFRLQRRLMRG